MTAASDFAVRYAAAQREHERRTGKATARKAKARKAAPQPTLKDYAASGLSALSSAANPQKTGMEVGQQIANAAPRVLGNIGDYIMGSSPMDVLRDVGRGAGAVGTYLSDPMNAASTALDFIPVIGDAKGLGQDLRSAAQLRASGDIAGARDYERLAIPLAVAGIVPGIGEARTAARLAGEGADVARAAERAASDLAVPRGGTSAFASVREGAAPQRATAVTRVPMRETAPELPSSVTGSYDATRNEPVTFRGKQPWELTGNEMADFGEAVGVPNIGPLNPLKTFKYADGDTFQVPGGLEGTFTYEDMARLKGEGINADRIDPSLHRELQGKLMRSMAEPEGLSDARVIQGLTFGMTSPNQPLFPNQLAMSRLRPASREQLEQVVNMRPWELNAPVTAADRAGVSGAITNAYGLNAGARGGLGVSGSVDYSRVADLNDLFLRDPAFFHRAEGEDWTDLVQRINSQTHGLGNKTTSFGVAWQPDAGVSAIDRHMVNRYMDTLLADPERRAAFEDRALNLARTRAEKAGREGPANYGGVNHGLIQELLLSEVGRSPSMKLRTTSGGISPRVPESLAAVDWIAEPRDLELMGDDYKGIIAANEAATQGSGLHLFGNQWNIWDRIRRRFEPHENMFPGLELIPRMNTDQLRVVDRQHMLSGHKNYTKEMVDGDPRLQPTKPVSHEALRHFSEGGMAVRRTPNLSAKQH